MLPLFPTASPHPSPWGKPYPPDVCKCVAHLTPPPPPLPPLAPPGLFVAAGHEGSGLCLGPATAELLSRHVLRHTVATTAAAGGSLDTASFAELLPDVRAQQAELA